VRSLASPASANSKPVDNEISSFRERHPDRPLIPLILEGAPGDPALPAGSARSRGRVLAADWQESGDGPQLALTKVVARLPAADNG
jgi:hypothetical protein